MSATNREYYLDIFVIKKVNTLKRLSIVLVLVLLLISGGARTQVDLVFINGQILTMDAGNRVVQAMSIVAGRIHDLGSTERITANITPSTQIINLNGRTLLPGFVDAHSHFPASGIRAVSVDLAPPPMGDTSTLEQLIDSLVVAAKNNNGNEWLLGYNYDNTAFNNGEHPTRAELDAAVPDQPVYLWHSSGHMGVANSAALALLDIDETSAPVSDATYGRDINTGKLNGLLQEKSAPALADIIKTYSLRKQMRIFTTARDDYLAAGITTIQNGFAGKNMMRALPLSQFSGLLPQRVIVWPAHKKQTINAQARYSLSNSTTERFSFIKGAVKILVDGSPQGMTAYLSEPYFNPRNHPAGYRGFALIDQAALNELVSDFHRRGYQLAMHGNGDAAIDSIINAVEAAQKTHHRPDARHLIVHAQTIRQDQIVRLPGLSLSPTFFTSHTYYWGDWHRQVTLGPARASNISPARWAQQAGIRFSLHSDTPVTPISQLQLLWSATKRQTQSGKTLGADQRIDMLSALRAITIDAAWQNHIDDAVGSLEVGKFADLVVLSQSPFEAEDVRQINVLATYINGVKHYEHATYIDGVKHYEHPSSTIKH